MIDHEGAIPFANKTGWPWNFEIPQIPPTMQDGSTWPKISIITPSFNQAEFIEETIRSVIMQGYPNLEYIIIDGGSTDGSVEIIKKYEEYLSYWVSEPDRGQAHAINKGFEICTGDLVGWINSDDTYLNNTFAKISEFFNNRTEIQFIYGKANFINHLNEKIGEYPSYNVQNTKNKYFFWRGWPIPQPTVFFRRRILDKIGLLNKNLNYAMDFEFFLRISEITKLHYYPEYLANYRLHQKSKTGNWELSRPNFYKECINIVENRFPKSKFSYSHIWFSWYLYQLKMFIKNPGKFKFIS